MQGLDLRRWKPPPGSRLCAWRCLPWVGSMPTPPITPGRTYPTLRGSTEDTTVRVSKAFSATLYLERAYYYFQKCPSGFSSRDRALSLEGLSLSPCRSAHGRQRRHPGQLRGEQPFHAMAEVGGVSISIRETAIPGDAVDETQSAWTLELVGVSGKICAVSWHTFRRSNEWRVGASLPPPAKR